MSLGLDGILQQLVIQLRMDGVNLVKTSEAINKDLSKFEKSAKKTQDRMSGLGSQTNKFGKEGAEAFAALRREALSYFAVITGGRGLTNFIKDITQSNVALSNLSQQLGIAPQRLAQFQWALRSVGSDPNSANNFFSTILQMSRDKDGLSTIRRLEQQYGVRFLNSDLTVRDDSLDQLHRSKKFQTQQRATQLGNLQQVGGSADLLNFIDSPRYAHIMRQFRDVGPTQEQMQQSRQLLQDWVKFEAESAKIFRQVYSDIEPIADMIVKDMTAFEEAHPKIVAAGLLTLAAAITTLGLVVGGSGLIRTAKLAGTVVKDTAAISTTLIKGTVKFAKFAATESVALVGKTWNLPKRYAKGGAEWLWDSSIELAENPGVRGFAGRWGARAALGATDLFELSNPVGWAMLGGSAIYEGYENWDTIKGLYRKAFGTPSAATVEKVLKKGGLSDVATKGVLARIARESRFNPSQSGDHGLAYGLLQWHPDRQKEFKQVFGHDIHQSSVEEQARFILWELHHTEKAAYRALEQAHSAGQAGAISSLLLARPKDKFGEAVKTARLAELVDSNLDAQTASLAKSQTNHFNVNIGDIHVSSNASHPALVAQEVKKAIPDHLKASLHDFSKSLVSANSGGIY